MAETTELRIDEGDKTLTFKIEKMNEFKAESWMIRTGILLGRELSEIHDFKDTKGLLHALCSVNYEDAKPLLDELLSCCFFKSDTFEKRMTDAGAQGIVSSPMTLLKLRFESAKFNFGFLLSGNLLNSLTETHSKPSARK